MLFLSVFNVCSFAGFDIYSGYQQADSSLALNVYRAPVNLADRKLSILVTHICSFFPPESSRIFPSTTRSREAPPRGKHLGPKSSTPIYYI